MEVAVKLYVFNIDKENKVLQLDEFKQHADEATTTEVNNSGPEVHAVQRSMHVLNKQALIFVKSNHDQRTRDTRLRHGGFRNKHRHRPFHST